MLSTSGCQRQYNTVVIEKTDYNSQTTAHVLAVFAEIQSN